MGAIRQTNFLAGEIAPLSWGRNDLPFFARGLRTMRNFFPERHHGSAVSRPGSLFIATTRDENDDGAQLLPFVYSDNQSFCIEMGSFGAGPNLYFRFYTDGAQLQATYLDVAVTTPFTAGQQVVGGTSGAKATIVSTGIAPSGGGTLQISPISGVFLNAEPLADALGGVGVAANIVETRAFEVQSGTVSNQFDFRRVRYAQTGDILTLTHPDWPPQELRRLPNVGAEPHWSFSSVVFKTANPSWSPGYPTLDSTTLPTPSASEPAREWAYLCTLTVQDTATGRVFETYPWRITDMWDGDVAHLPVALSDDLLAIYPDKPVTILKGAHLELRGDNAVDNSYRAIAMNVYRGRGELFGLVGTTTADYFIDIGEDPDFAVQPPHGNNPFRIVDYASAVTVEHPAAVAFFQDRRCFASTPSRPASVFASATGDYTNFDRHDLIQVAGEALEFELAARRFEQVKHLLAHQKMILGTGSSVWSMAGAGGAPLDFDSVDAKVIDEVGMTDLVPLMFEGRVIYARAKGSGVRGLFFDSTYGTYQGLDLSSQSDHLFIGDSIGFQGTRTTKELLDWTYAEDPWGIVWAVRRDGTLLSMTMRGQEYGWARHDGSATTRADGPTYRRVCSVPEGDEDAVYMLVTRAIAGSFGKTCVERMTSRVRRGNAEDDACVDCGLRYEGVPTLTITGLDHLWQESVYVVGVDNSPQGPYVVEQVNIGTLMAPLYSYQITLGELPKANAGGGVVVLFVGLLYTPDLETLDIVSADSKLKQKAVTRIGFELDQSAGILAGEDFDHLTESRPNTVASGFNAPVPGTSLVIITPSRKWGIGGRAVLRQSKPLPVTVVGLTRELEVGG